MKIFTAVMPALLLASLLVAGAPAGSEAGGGGFYISTGGITVSVGVPFYYSGHYGHGPWRGRVHGGWYAGGYDRHRTDGGVVIHFGYPAPGYGYFGPPYYGPRPYYAPRPYAYYAPGPYWGDGRHRPPVRATTRIWVPGRMTGEGYVRGHWETRAIVPK